MGLQERRKMKELQEVVLPERVREIEEICGKAIPYEVDWSSLENDFEALNFLDNLSCHRLNMALRVICSDDLGREAVRDGLTLVKLGNVGTRDEMVLAFDGGVLTMKCAYAMGANGMHGDGAIREALLAKL